MLRLLFLILLSLSLAVLSVSRSERIPSIPNADAIDVGQVVLFAGGNCANQIGTPIPLVKKSCGFGTDVCVDNTNVLGLSVFVDNFACLDSFGPGAAQAYQGPCCDLNVELFSTNCCFNDPGGNGYAIAYCGNTPPPGCPNINGIK